jgi:hypothetical protein
LSTSLKMLIGMLVAGLALALVTLAALPGMAEAQTVDGTSIEAEQNVNPTNAFDANATAPAPPESRPVDRLVVSPGDSLWSISHERLGSGASPGLIAQEVGRIYELNRERIGDDPNLILAGHELLLTRGSEPAAVTVPATEFATTTAEEPMVTSEQPAVAGATPGQKDERTPEPPTPEPAQERAAEGPISATDVEPSGSEPPYAAPRKPEMLTLLLSAGLFLFALAVAVYGMSKMLRRRKLFRGGYEPAVRQDELRDPGHKADETGTDASAPKPSPEHSRTLHKR